MIVAGWTEAKKARKNYCKELHKLLSCVSCFGVTLLFEFIFAMNKTVNFMSAFLLAFSQMFSFVPGTGRNLKGSDTSFEPFDPGIENSFAAAWGYISKAVEDDKKQQAQ